MKLDGRVADVAPTLLNAVLRGNGVAVRLTEVEAYEGESDPGSHAFRGRTRRTDVMFGPPGRAYVYFTYGMHWCMNIVCGPDGFASAVLLRAGEVVDGIELARSRRPRSTDRDLARGPARLTKVLNIDSAYGGVDLLDPASPLTLTAGDLVDPARVRTGPRVGVGGAGAATPWRFWLDDDPTVSVYRPAMARRRRTFPG
ncbi:MAG: DNA-3-methyladenine glycosylase [Frankiales bacterium]|nr:DNA-3-methyladenine glycosylase [Frankiales bacterium]